MKPFTAPFLEDSLGGVPLLIMILLGCSAGFLLFGYDQGIANALTQSPDFIKKFPQIAGKENSTLLGATLSFFVLGAFFGCVTITFLGNRFGRRSILIAAGLGTLLGGGLQAGSVNLEMLMIARLINGFAVGQLTCTVPPYVAELTKPATRGMLMSIELVLGASGLMSAFWVTYAFRHDTGPTGWRMPLAIQAMLVLISLFCLMFSPETPRYLVETGKPEEGHRILARLYGTQYADEALEEIKAAVALEHAVATRTWSSCFENNDQCFRYRTLCAIFVNFFQQATGINIATYYAGSIFIQGIGLQVDTALLVLGNLGVVGLIFTAAGCFYFVDNVGRVRTMMLGAFLNCIAMILLAAGLTQTDANGLLQPKASYAAAVGLFLFIASFSGFWLVPSWIYGAEITPLAIRSRSNSMGIATQFLFNFVVVMVTPTGIAKIGGYYYVPWAVSNAIIVVLLHIYFPEPARLGLEQVDQLFEGGKVHVRRSPREQIKPALTNTYKASEAASDKLEDDRQSVV